MVPASSQIIGAIEFGQYWVRVPTVPPIVQGRQLHPLTNRLWANSSDFGIWPSKLTSHICGMVCRYGGHVCAHHSECVVCDLWNFKISHIWHGPGIVHYVPGGNFVFKSLAVNWPWTADCKAFASSLCPELWAKVESVAIFFKMGHTWFSLGLSRIHPSLVASVKSFLDTASAQLAPLDTLSIHGESLLSALKFQKVAMS